MSILSDEITSDPLGRGYSTMSDLEAANDLNTAYQEVNRTSMTRQEVLDEIEPAALAALSGDNATKVFGMLSDTVNPFGNAAQVLIDAFGSGSQTIINLAAARKHTISRAQELGITVNEGDVSHARAI